MKIIVKYMGRTEEYSVNPKSKTVFFDAAVMAMNALAKRKKKCVGAVISCEKKGQKSYHLINTYFALLASDLKDKAPMMREKFLKLYDIDLANSPETGKFKCT
jgi:hypothetical protein